MGEIADLSVLRPATPGTIAPSQMKKIGEVLPNVFENVLLSTTPAARRRSAPSLMLSLLLHGALIAAIFTLQFSNTLAVFPTSSQHVTLIAPYLPPPLPRIEAPKPRLAALPPAPPVVAPRRFEAPLPPRPPATPKIAVEPPPALAVVTSQPVVPVPVLPHSVAPPPPLKTDNLAEMRAPLPVPVAKVPIQSAGFAGAESRAPNTPRGRVLMAGFSGVDSSAAPASTPRSVTANAGAFGNASAAADAATRRGLVAKGGFGDTTVAAATRPSPAAASVAPGTTQVEILSKPLPVYTEEGRRLQIEGEVLVELLFSASGEARVLRIVRGLGHGLDENAIAAAQGIRFRPALSHGTPVDTTAIVHIVYRLAY